MNKFRRFLASKAVPRSILVVCTQRIGDVLLTTPLVHSLKSAWPDCQIDFLALPGTEGVLAGNPDIREVLSFTQRTHWRGKLAQFARIWHRYDIALATIPTDRARLFAWAAAPISLGFVTGEESSLKQGLLTRALPFDDRNTHTVSMGLRLAAELGISPKGKVRTPRLLPGQWEARARQLGLSAEDKYAVIHPSPKFRYKMWTVDNWVAVITCLRQRNLRVALTGSNDPEEAAYVQNIADRAGNDCDNLGGKLNLAETAELISRAALFIGPDTAVTHIAAATGIPTIALFGPSNPVKWGPWPANWNGPDSPWSFTGSKRCNNVWLIQGKGDCVPCLLEGCDRHLDSISKCLEEISVERVLVATESFLGEFPLTKAI